MTKDHPYSLAFGKVLKRERIKQGLTQEELGYRCEYDRSYVSGVERGKRNPTLLSARTLIITGLHLNYTSFVDLVEQQFEKEIAALNND